MRFRFTILSILVLAGLFLGTAPAPAQAQVVEEAPLLLVNKEHPLPADYSPSDLVWLANYVYAGSSQQMCQSAAEAMQRMMEQMEEDGYGLAYGSSGYRSYGTQNVLYQRKINYYRALGYSRDSAAAEAGTVVAPPGTSEHQSGLAIDITSSENGYAMDETFGDTMAGKWLYEHCGEYGFILRYGENKSELTGYIFEPWHFRYVGQPHAYYMMENDLCLEEYISLLQQGSIYMEYGSHCYVVMYILNKDEASVLPWQDIAVRSLSLEGGPYIAIADLSPQERFEYKENIAQTEIAAITYRVVYGRQAFIIPWMPWDGLNSLKNLPPPNNDSVTQHS